MVVLVHHIHADGHHIFYSHRHCGVLFNPFFQCLILHQVRYSRTIILCRFVIIIVRDVDFIFSSETCISARQSSGGVPLCSTILLSPTHKHGKIHTLYAFAPYCLSRKELSIVILQIAFHYEGVCLVAIEWFSCNRCRRCQSTCSHNLALIIDPCLMCLCSFHRNRCPIPGQSFAIPIWHPLAVVFPLCISS